MKKLEIVSLTACLVLLGACGFTDHEVVQNTCSWTTGGGAVNCAAACPAGKKVTGGGWSAEETLGGLVESELIRDEGRVVADFPTGNDSQWVAAWEPNPASSGDLHVWAICAKVGTP